MTPRPTPPRELTEAFRKFGLGFYRHQVDDAPEEALRLYDGGPACWLYQHDPLGRPCSGRLEVVHLLSRQRIRNTLRPLITDINFELLDDAVAEIVELAEWDVRLGVPGCEGHHRRFDSQCTPALRLPAAVLPARFIDFVHERGFEVEAERKFEGFAQLAGADADHREGTTGNLTPEAIDAAASGSFSPASSTGRGTLSAPGVVGGVGSGESALRTNPTERSTQ